MIVVNCHSCKNFNGLGCPVLGHPNDVTVKKISKEEGNALLYLYNLRLALC